MFMMTTFHWINDTRSRVGWRHWSFSEWIGFKMIRFLHRFLIWSIRRSGTVFSLSFYSLRSCTVVCFFPFHWPPKQRYRYESSKGFFYIFFWSFYNRRKGKETLGFMRSSRCGLPVAVSAFISVWMHVVLPEPLGPRIMMPCLTNCVCGSTSSPNRAKTKTTKLINRKHAAIDLLFFLFASKGHLKGGRHTLVGPSFVLGLFLETWQCGNGWPSLT